MPAARPGPLVTRSPKVIENPTLVNDPKADAVASLSRWQTFWRWLRQVLGITPAVSTPGMVDHGDRPSSVVKSRPRPGKRLRVGVVSTVGNYREHNEDNFYLPTKLDPVADPSLKDREYLIEVGEDDVALKLFVVADGMGGQLGGEKASQMAVEIIPKELSRRLNPATSAGDKAIQRAVRDAVAAANQEILGLSVVQTEFNNMGTTVVLALFHGGRLYIAGIGDSRAYRIRDGRVEQMTKDHSLAWALFEAGTITAEELPNHKFSHVLYLYLGSKDARGGPEDVHANDLVEGDRFLLASDGLTGVVGDDQLAAIVTQYDDPRESARILMQMALDNHSKDNITCLVIHVV